MATIDGTSIGGMTLQAEYSYTPDPAKNQTSVTVILRLIGHYALYASALTGSYISIGGTKTNYNKSISYGGSSTTSTELVRQTVIVSHNSDGTATCNISGTFVMNGTYRGYSVTTMSVSKTITLPTIARSSSFTVSSSVNTGSAISGTVTPSSNAFNHKLLLKVGTTTKATITMAVGTTAFSYTIGHDWFPSSTSGIITAVLETYNGSTLIATTSKNITANVPTSVVPYVGSLTAAIATNGLSGLYVQGKTTVKLTANSVSAGSGSSIKSYTYSGPNVTSSSNSATVATNNITTAAVSTAGTLTYTVQVIDNRGRTASANVSITVYPYTAPSIGPVSVQRCDANGNLSQSGTYAKYTVNSSYSNVGAKNTRTVTAAYSSNNGSTYSAETTLQAVTDTSGTKSGVYGGGVFALASNYIIRFTIKDAYGATKTVTAPLQSAARPVNIRQNGKGVAIGGMSTKDEFEVFMPADFNSSVNIDGHTVTSSITANGVINAKESIHFGGLNGQTKELQLRFSNPTNSTNPHNLYIFGGNPNDSTAIGLYDAGYSRVMMSYDDKANRMNFGNGSTEIRLNGSTIAAYVVEVGVSGSWTYRKWSNGTSECWGTINGTLSPYTTFNGFSGYEGGIDFPSGLFNAVPNVQFQAYIGNGFAIPARGGISTATQFKWVALSNVSTANTTVKIDAFAIGRWK